LSRELIAKQFNSLWRDLQVCLSPHYSSRGEFVQFSDVARSVNYFSQYLGLF
jgi:hypothetical protein